VEGGKEEAGGGLSSYKKYMLAERGSGYERFRRGRGPMKSKIRKGEELPFRHRGKVRMRRRYQKYRRERGAWLGQLSSLGGKN